MNHLDGAAKLLEARGPEQLSRPEGLDMFTQLRAQIVSWPLKTLPPNSTQGGYYCTMSISSSEYTYCTY